MLLFLGWGPYAYFRALEETNSGTRGDAPVDGVGVGMQNVEIANLNQHSRRNSSNGFRQVSLSDSVQVDVEYGRV